MSIFSGFIDKVKTKKADLDEKREFLEMVDKKAKPLRRAAYMKQAIRESVNQGIALAKFDAEKKLPKKKKETSLDFGIKENPKDVKDQWAFLDDIGIVKEKDKTLIKQKSKNKK